MSPAAARASSLRVRGGTTRDERACRDVGVPCVSEPGDVLPVAGNEGAACAHARVPRDPGFPPLPRGCVRASVGARSRAGRAGLGGGGLPGPTRPPSVPAASGPSRASPSLPFPRTAASPRASRACVAPVACRVEVASLPLPGGVPTVGEQRLTRPLLGVGDPVLALWGRDLSLGCGLWRERRSVVSRRVAGRVGARRRRRAFPSAAAGASVSAAGSVREGARGELRAFREPREGRRLSGRPSSAAWRWVSPAEVRLGTLPAPSSSSGEARLVWGTATAPGWVPGGEIPPACVLFHLRCGGGGSGR